jgi:hypothetical protein
VTPTERSTPDVSILLPTHNRPEVLEHAIRSILAQTFADFELLVVGDGCTDRTAELVRSFGDARIVWLDFPKAPHFGYANLNAALERARGALIAYQAHDDLWMPDHLELLLRELEDPAVDLAYSRPLWVEPDGRLVPSSFNLHDEAVLADFLGRRRNSIPAACVACRRACLLRRGGWNADLDNNGDWDLWARIIAGDGGKRLAYVPAPTTLHFRANWRTERNAGPRELAVWRQWYHDDAGFGAGLRLAVPADGLPQPAAWEEMSLGGAAWVRAVRAAVQQALDRVVDREGQALSLLAVIRAQAEETERLRRTLAERNPGELAGHDPCVFGEGVYAEQDGARWIARRAVLHLRPAGGPPATAVLTLACGDAAWYPRFPVSVRVGIDGENAGTLVFDAPFAARRLSLPLVRAKSTLLLDCDGWFVPKALGVNDDVRELALCLRSLTIAPPPGPEEAPGDA